LPGSPPAHVVVFGAGTVAVNACDIAVALGAKVTVVSLLLEDLRRIEDRWPNRLTTLPSTPANIEKVIEGADLLISGALVRGGREAPQLVSRQELSLIGSGGVIVDVAIDQGGTFETSRPTTHHDPVFVEKGVVHYCVANMPGAVPRTSTSALTAATLSYVLKLAQLRTDEALKADPALARGLMTRDGDLVNTEVREALAL
jgi:alanine dehydrogenase